MAPASPLHVDRAQLITALEERLARDKEERAAREKEVEDRNAEARDVLIELLNESPEFLVRISSFTTQEYGGSDIMAAARYVRQRHQPPAVTKNFDETLERLIRLYKLGSDDSVELSVNDEVHNYI